MAKLHEKLIETARYLTQAKSSLGIAASRRAVSTAYYAAFSQLSELCARALSRARVNAPSYRSAFRMLDHGSTREALNRDSEFKAPIGEPFARLQEARYWADYEISPHPDAIKAKAGKTFTRREALLVVDRAAEVVAAINRLDANARQRLAVLLVARVRR
jgi:uncharacterized protein (UPF0332 family)